jgi:hypothetical protein
MSLQRPYASFVALALPWDALTAIGTLALAAVTVAAVIVTLVITYQDRKRAEDRIRDERQHDRQLEQDQQASDVYVTRTATGRLRTVARRLALAVTVVNGGDYTITQVMVRFAIDGRLEDPERAEHVPAPESSALAGNADILGYPGVLAPGTGLRVTLAAVKGTAAPEAMPIVRWTDRWSQRWEYRKGVARRIRCDEEWIA